MSQENVEVVRQAFQAFNRRDKDAWLTFCDPEYETVPSADWPEIEPITGAEAAWDFYVAADDAWEPGPYEFDDASAVGDQVVGHLRREARGKASGAAVSYSYWIVVTFHDTRVRRIEWFTGRTEALEAVGLSEQDAHADS
jgi:ketosteroid isomerase-like protein